MERYATSKIISDEDLLTLESYGFRGEALASIAEVAKVMITTKTTDMPIGMQIAKRGEQIQTKSLPTDFHNGTIIMVEDLFFNVPARLKFLKSGQTEFYYCYNYVTDIALGRPEIAFSFTKNEKMIHDLPTRENLLDRVSDIFKKDRSEHMRSVWHEDKNLLLEGVVADSSLRFGSAEYIKIYVNNRPVQDKIIKKAIMDAYQRQIVPGEFPFAILFLTLPGTQVDVNVHPSKLQVKFADPQHIYTVVTNAIVQALSQHKIITATIPESYKFSAPQETLSSKPSYTPQSHKPTSAPIFSQATQVMVKRDMSSFTTEDVLSSISPAGDAQEQSDQTMHVVGQLWNMYVLLESEDALFYVDQHALAERIAFEKMKKEKNLTSEVILEPIRIPIVYRADIEDKIAQLQQLGFDCALLGENSLVVYAVPHVFVQYPVDLEKFLQHVMDLEEISFDHVFDMIFAMKACKTSIKAGDRLSIPQMQQLINDGFEHIPSMFVCQHGRPFFIRIAKKDIDTLVDR